MNKRTWCAAAAAVSFCALGAENSTADSTNALETASSPIFSGYVSADLASGYLLYGALLNSEPCLWTDVRADAALGDFGYLGLQVWSNSDLTDRRKRGMGKDGYGKMGKAFNEHDLYVHYGNSFAFTDDISLSFEFAHVWFWYPDHEGANGKGYATTREINLYLELANPWVTPYFFITHEYSITDGTYMAGGLKRDCAVTESLTLTPSIELNGYSQNYFGSMFPYNSHTFKACDTGVGALMLSLKGNYRVTDWFSIHAQVAYVSVVNDEVRGAIDDTENSTYMKDFAWGMVGCTLSF